MKEELITIPKFEYESEKKMRFFGASSEKIHKKKFNIFIGISINNKKLTPGMALNYLKWAVRNTKGKVAVIIADELNIVNYRILDKYSLNKSVKRAKKVGEEFQKLFDIAIKKLSFEERKKVRIFKWEEVKREKYYLKIKELLEKEYKKDLKFKSAILYFVNKYMRKKGRIIKEQGKIDVLAKYILGELPTLLQGIYLEKDHYGLCVYPTYFSSGMSQFVMDIHEKELDIGKKLKKYIKKRGALVEAWLD